MSKETIVLLWDFIKLIISGAVGAYVVHLLTNRRLKKEQHTEIINKQIHQIYTNQVNMLIIDYKISNQYNDINLI